jgi:hypothetical protein
MAKIRDLPLGTYPNGTVSFGPRLFSNGLAGFDIRIGRCTTADTSIWTNATTIVTIDLQFSYDGGSTYTALGANSWSGPGGIVTSHGVEIPETVLTWDFNSTDPNFAKPNALKGQITVTGGPIKTYLDTTLA